MAGYSRAQFEQECEAINAARRVVWNVRAQGLLDGFALETALSELDAQETRAENKLRMVARSIADRALDKHRASHVTEPRGMGLPSIAPTGGASRPGLGLQPGLSVSAPRPAWRGNKPHGR
jgi:hypothetical protein